jgi:hypothetical protein
MDSFGERGLMRRKEFLSWIPLYTIHIKGRLKKD